MAWTKYLSTIIEYVTIGLLELMKNKWEFKIEKTSSIPWKLVSSIT